MPNLLRIFIKQHVSYENHASDAQKQAILIFSQIMQNQQIFGEVRKQKTKRTILPKQRTVIWNKVRMAGVFDY